MTRRHLLSTIELALTASALFAAVYGLVRAAYNPYAAVQWVPIAIIGVGTALALTAVAAVLFVGKAALLLAPDAVQATRSRFQRRQLKAELAALPRSSGRMKSPEVIAEHRARAAAEEHAHAAAMATVAAEHAQPQQPQTIGYTAILPTVAEPSWGFSPHVGDRVVEPPLEAWTAPVSDTAARHAGLPDSLMARYDYEPAGMHP